MKRVKQINLDIVVDESADGYNFAEEVADFLSQNGFDVLGADFQEDMTDVYKNEYGYDLDDME